MHPLSHLPRAGLVSSLTVLLTLAACGGGSDSTSDGTDTVDPAGTLRGTVVVNGTVQNAVVCMDLNANETCDPDEPASAPTAANGSYLLRYDPASLSADRVAAASLIAPQRPGQPTDPATTIDTADGQAVTGRPYVLRQVPGKAGQINPLTTLVAAGVAAGMSESVARANAADQLGVAVAKIDNYLDDPALDEASIADTARQAANVVAQTLESGLPLVVGDPAVASDARDNDLRSLTYLAADDWRWLDFRNEARAAAETTVRLIDRRVGSAINTNRAPLYNQAFLTANGWLSCNESVPVRAKLGVPARSTFCDGRDSIGARGATDIAGRRMADVVTDQRSVVGNAFSGGGANTALIAALGDATFPAGSTLRPGRSLNLSRPIFINSVNTDGFNQNVATTLEQLIAARPASGANLSNAGGTLSLGLGSANLKNLRVAFTGTTSATAGTVQFYECDLNEAQTVASNCAATQTGTYGIATVNGVRVMRFEGHAPTVMNHVRGYAEVKSSTQANGVIGSGPVGSDWVFVVRWQKPDLASNQTQDTRLNAIAWAAMKTRLGL